MSLSVTEQKSVIEKYEEPSLLAVGLPTKYNDYWCAKAKEIANKGNFDEAIILVNEKVVSKSSVKAIHLNALAELYIDSNQFVKALQTLQNATNLDPSELKVKLNLAHAYMFMNEVSKAKEIHKKYMNQNISAKQTWKNKAINDLDRFKKSNLPQDNIQKIWRLYN
jgi:predicted Zn-dependent protease